MPPGAKTPAIAIDLLVEAEGWPPRRTLSRLVRRAIPAAAARAGRALAEGSEVAVIFADDARVRVLNRKFRKKDKPTNVLSFPGQPAAAGRFGPLLGDIVLARETIEGEALAGHLTLADHLTHLIVHGFLHLLGYDHEHDAEAADMERLETVILGDLGVADPYGHEDG